jgi:hypothetical protein
MTTTTDRSELLANLSEGIAKLTTSDDWQRHLDCQSRFYRYSLNNVMLIAQQRHEATMIAGFNAWKKHGRFVRKGEKAIWILALMVYKESDDETSEENERVIRGFKWVPVLDIAFTDGADLPTVCQKLTGDDPAGLYSRLADVAHSIGFAVENAELPGTVNGDCTHTLHRIRVEITNSPAQRVKTLAQEIGHALLHEECDNRRLLNWKLSPLPTLSASHLGSIRATTPSGRSRPGPVVVTKPSPGSRDPATASRRLHQPSSGLSRRDQGIIGTWPSIHMQNSYSECVGTVQASFFLPSRRTLSTFLSRTSGSQMACGFLGHWPQQPRRASSRVTNTEPLACPTGMSLRFVQRTTNSRRH